MKYIRVILVAALMITFCLSGEAQEKPPRNQQVNPADIFLIDKTKPGVYITFEKKGEAPPLFRGESATRYWLRLRNNTRASISFCHSKVDTKYGDIAVRYEIEQNTNFGSFGGLEDEPPKISKAPDNEQIKRNPEVPSNGNSMGDACLVYDLLPGKSVLFSIPKEHLINALTNFSIKIQYRYEWEKSATEYGSQPTHYIFFSSENLPFSEKK